jgi:U3 small nucleolar RNA-associated protein 10
LESALKADAYEGGNWIRGDDGQRHTLILEPLGKLLQAKIPPGVPVVASLEEKELVSTSTYQKLVEGVGTLDYGSVVGCMRALAMAAGDEQMWKPINHALLEACGVDDRPEVRKAGISCLKSIMESIGEEYMVLLPECLPILSELLEDEEEEIAGLARECVTLGEELLGESLEDSLR